MVTVLLTFLTGCSDKEYVLTTAFEAKELMRINNKSCYLNQMMLYLTTIQNKYEDVYGVEVWEQEQDGVTLEQKVKDMVLAKVAQVMVMDLMAESYGVSLTKEEESYVEEVSKAFYESLNDREIELLELEPEDITEYYTQYALANKVYETVIEDVNEEISDDEARLVTVYEILIKTYALDADGNRLQYSKRAKEEALAKANGVLSMLSESDDSFESIAAKYNEADEMTHTYERGELPEALEEVVFSLDMDAVSDVVEDENGYHIIKCIGNSDMEKTQANKVAILEKRKEELFDKTYDEYLTTLRKTLNEKLYDSITMIHDESLTTKTFFDVNF